MNTSNIKAFCRDHVVFVTFASAVAGIVVRIQGGACQVVTGKKKGEIVGEQHLPLCKIVLSELTTYEESVRSFGVAQNIPLLLFPSDSDQEIFDTLDNEPDKTKLFEGAQALAHFRFVLKDLAMLDDDLEVSIQFYLKEMLTMMLKYLVMPIFLVNLRYELAFMCKTNHTVWSNDYT